MTPITEEECLSVANDESPLPSVAVVVATYLRSKSLAAFVGCALADPAVTELIIVVDGCRDGSYELLREIAESETRLRPLFVEHRGQIGALEAGVRAASSEIILLLDDDVMPRRGLVSGHACRHVGRSRQVVLGYMPVALPTRRRRGDASTVLYAKEYEGYCARIENGHEDVLRSLWGGNVSLRREDCLAVGLASDEFHTFYFSDRDFGLRLAAAGMVGLFDRSLEATHLHKRSSQGFVDDSVSQGIGMALLHRIHYDRLGALEEASIYRDLPVGVRWFVRRFGPGRLSRPLGLTLMKLGVAFGTVRAFRLEMACAQLARRLCQLRGVVQTGTKSSPLAERGAALCSAPSSPSSVPATEHGYDASFFSFFDWSREMSRSSAEVIVPVLLEVAPCDSVLDVGCGVGAWLAAFGERGVSVTGVDGSDVPDAMLMVDPRHVLRHDLSLPLDLGRRFDLVISLGVAEHLPAAAAEVFVDSLVRHGDIILFSAAIPRQGGYHQLNERWQSYWALLFQERGYQAFDILRPRVWKDERVSWWYAQNSLVYVRQGSQPALQLPAPSQVASLDVVHPSLWSEATSRVPGTREALRLMVQAARTRMEKLRPKDA